MTPEGKVKERIKSLLTQHGVWWFMPMGQLYGRRGVPDFVCCHNGTFFTVETKAKGKRPTGLQDHVMEQIRTAGGRTFVVVGEDDGGLEEWLSGRSGIASFFQRKGRS